MAAEILGRAAQAWTQSPVNIVRGLLAIFTISLQDGAPSISVGSHYELADAGHMDAMVNSLDCKG